MAHSSTETPELIPAAATRAMGRAGKRQAKVLSDVDKSLQAHGADYRRSLLQRAHVNKIAGQARRREAGDVLTLTTVHLPPAALARLGEIAAERGTTAAACMREAIVGWIARVDGQRVQKGKR